MEEPAATEPPPSEETPAPRPARSRPAPPAEPQSVTITTTPAGAFVVIQDEFPKSCTSPCSLSVLPGRYAVSANLAGHQRAVRYIEVPTNLMVHLVLQQMTGKLIVKTNPAGATILVNSVARPEKTPAVLSLPVGKYKIALEKEGFLRQEDEVTVRDGVLSTMEINWTP